MRKILTTLVISLLVIFSSCSTLEEQNTLLIEKQEVEDGLNFSDQRENLEQVFASLDSLNNTFVGHMSRGYNWRGFWRGVTDEVGGCIGGHYGARAGAAAGTAISGGPGVGTTIGAITGQIIGRAAGSGLASAVYDYLLPDDEQYLEGSMSLCFDMNIKPSEMISNDDTDTGKRDSTIIGVPKPGIGLTSVPDVDYIDIPSVEETNLDMTGYTHNYAMYSINQNKSMYLSNGKVNIDLLYEGLILYYEEVNYPVWTSEVMDSLTINIKNHAMKIGEITLRLHDEEKTYDELIDAHCTYMESLGLEENDILIYRNFSAKILYKCSELTIPEIHLYAMSINSLLKNLDLDIDLKKRLALIAQMAINSSICWK